MNIFDSAIDDRQFYRNIRQLNENLAPSEREIQTTTVTQTIDTSAVAQGIAAVEALKERPNHRYKDRKRPNQRSKNNHSSNSKEFVTFFFCAKCKQWGYHTPKECKVRRSDLWAVFSAHTKPPLHAVSDKHFGYRANKRNGGNYAHAVEDLPDLDTEYNNDDSDDNAEDFP
jgi:hypothetical protein